MKYDEILETLKGANEVIAKQQAEIMQLRLAIGLLKYVPPKKEMRGRKRGVSKKSTDILVGMEPVMKEYFTQTGKRYSREKWIYMALQIMGISQSDHSAKRTQITVIKNMSAAKKIQE